ncbi:MAG: adenine deaminase [Allobaculum sp.]|nr:adenine deaminase [Allobaculum sp.]
MSNKLKQMIAIARGEEKADVVLKNAQIVNVFTNQILQKDIALYQERIVGIGHYEGKKTIDLENKFVVPGLIDAHFHIESSMATPFALSFVLLKHGVCTVIADPHEIVNATGKVGLNFMLEDAQKSALDYFFMIPSSVPSRDFEINGAGFFSAQDMEEYAHRPEVLGLAEVMRMDDVLNADPRMIQKFDLFSHKIIDGHAPGLNNEDLQAYRLAGVVNDHEASTYKEAIQRLQNGFQLFIRQGSGAKNLEAILTGLLEHHIPLNHCSFCTDDKHLEDIYLEGTIDQEIREAIDLGCNPIEAIKMATINTATHYGLKDRGAIAPGYKADLVILKDLSTFEIEEVWKDGKPFQALSDLETPTIIPKTLQNSVFLPLFTKEQFKISQGSWHGIQLIPSQLSTQGFEVNLTLDDFPSAHYNILCAAERYGKTGEFAFCPVKGYDLKGGAIAMSYAHDSHNAIAIADNIEDLVLALNTLQSIQGGIVVVEKGRVFDALSMRAAGLMSDLPAEEIVHHVSRMKEKVVEMGVSKDIDPFANLSFLSLPVIPEVRLCPQGYYDVISQSFLSQPQSIHS